MIGIIDYGMGNLHSVTKALERLGHRCFLSEKPHDLEKATQLILPGVGSFKDGMIELEKRQLDVFIKDWAGKGNPLLGICLGMQLLFEKSEENGLSNGLNLLPGHVTRFKEGAYKIPHMGWNRLTFNDPTHPILHDVPEGHVYFVHSYFVNAKERDVLVATANYGGEQVPAVVAKKSVWGTQFHPEKSSEVGMRMLRNYVNQKGVATYE
ncbi:imidazole glycerol phosphate synthase subunit HisH [Salipaludibacillus agaradhaerens]|jgi:glutamine amidotransferase|uniref:imidazole glycerol phosphate synthase subunit HisH n=1 Tax=Salipaludibacillus agaradhaerens TaxID=76935 RepID=UPI000996A1F6|nr:imidazole glycerol phosphate synthase subunit HisH [Salipaludibacillus agaradhaerens]MCR6107947.1 imidazole glycerol phosphate synthase subunit HisH [Salipaludibacillus agaradhaerens]MCR6119973.1 imidazole glycerol phosphate synthase subunit HisH [Salipaludibacillus agaradhaerens]UJW59024.1 imidazole glycerol phosphate synthase subunit HisH [Bacillus sp. A116_S68]